MSLQTVRKVALYRAVVCLALIGSLWGGVAERAGAVEAKAVTVPLIQRGVHVFVNALIDGKPMLFALDTGAGANVLTPQAAERLNLKPDKGQVNVLGAGGNTPPSNSGS